MEGSASYSLRSGSVSQYTHTHTHAYIYVHQFYESETISHLCLPFCFQRWETWSSSAQCKTTTWLNMALTVPSSPPTCGPTVSSPATPCAMSHRLEPCVGQTRSGRTGYAVPTYLSFGPLCSKTTRLKRQTWMPLGNRWEMVGRLCWMYVLWFGASCWVVVDVDELWEPHVCFTLLFSRPGCCSVDFKMCCIVWLFSLFHL